MKKILILLLSVVPLLFTSCFGLWGPHEEDIITWFAGNLYADGKYMENPKVYFEGSKINVSKDSLANLPYVYVEWKTLENETIVTSSARNPNDCSFETDCFLIKNPTIRKDGQDLMDISVLTFTYYPESGEPVEVSFEGKELTAVNKHTFYVTLDFDTKTVYPNELK